MFRRTLETRLSNNQTLINLLEKNSGYRNLNSPRAIILLEISLSPWVKLGLI